MGKKLYEKTETGGIRFSSGRKPGEVRVPNYVYDLWLPLLGVVAIGVYNLYCRLERENIVKAISLKNIANACRIGTDRLNKINEALKKCGFIEIAKPTGWKRLAHYTTEFKVLDPPREVPTWAIEEYAAERGYDPLTPWLVAEEIKTPIGGSENPNGFSGEPERGLDKDPDGTPNVVTLGLQPLGVELVDVEANFPTPPSPGGVGADFEQGGNTDDDSGHSIVRDTGAASGRFDDSMDNPQSEIGDDFDVGTDLYWQHLQEAAANKGGNWAVPAPAGGDDGFRDGPVDAFCKILAGFSPKKLPKEKRESWGDKLQEIAKEWSTDETTITPAIMEAAICAIPEDDNTGWRSFSSPYSDNFDKHIGPLLLNEGKPRQKGDRHGARQGIHSDRKRRTPDQWRDPVPT